MKHASSQSKVIVYFFMGTANLQRESQLECVHHTFYVFCVQLDMLHEVKFTLSWTRARKTYFRLGKLTDITHHLRLGV